MSDDQSTMLAPSPDFRYVGLKPGPQLGARVAASLFLAGGGVGAGLLRELGLLEASFGALLAATGLALLWRRVGAKLHVGVGSVPFAIVPWGVLVEHADGPRVLRWAAVRSLHVHTMYGRDSATTSTLWSLVTLRTEHEIFAGRTFGAAPLERLLAHLEAYTSEQERPLALDLDGAQKGSGLLEPQFEELLSAALEILHSPSSQRLGVESSYRMTSARAGTDTIAAIRRILRDRQRHATERRPLAAVLAAELGLSELAPDLTALVQSPHPLVAATAKAAALRLGVPGTKVGLIDEVAPFLSADDVLALGAWCVSPTWTTSVIHA